MHMDFEDFFASLQRAQPMLQQLKVIVASTHTLPEGNCFWLHTTFDEHDALKNKQCNLYSMARQARSIMEIGFNAGHSALLFLLANPSSTLVCFDICAHPYTKPCFEYLASCFPGRMSLVKGDSLQTVPLYKQQHPDTVFDVVHVDGHHDPVHVEQEVNNVLALVNTANPSHFLILDDDDYPPLHRLHRTFLERGILTKVTDDPTLLPTTLYAHMITRVATRGPPLHAT